MCIPPRATATPTVVVQRRTRLPFFYTLLFLLPLVLLFATAQAASAVDVCTTDTAGANDEPGQKDLTKLCSDIGGGAAQLIDVCSYPSQQPNSDPSDCVNYSADTGRLEVRKVLRPANNPGRFNLLIDSSIEASAVGDGGTTGEKIVDAGQHTVSETTATNTNLGEYNTWIECRDNNGTGSVVAAQANNSPLSVTVPDGSDIVCTILNVRQTGTIYVNKVVDWNGIPADQNQTFEICIFGPSYPDGNCQTTDYDGGLLTWPGVETDYYDIVETDAGSAWSVVIDSSPVSVPCNGSVSATVTNTRKRGSLQVTKTVNWNGVQPDSNQSFTICIVGPSYTNGDCKSVGFNGGALTWKDLIPGVYDVAENNPGRVWETVVTGSPATVPADGGQASAAIANKRLQPARITVTKILTTSETTHWSFVLRLTGADPRTVTDKETSTTWEDLEPNRSYVLSEDEPGTPWVEGEFACTIGGVAVGEIRGDDDIQLTLRPADHAICAKYNGLVSSGTALEPVDEPIGSFQLYLPTVRH